MQNTRLSPQPHTIVSLPASHGQMPRTLTRPLQRKLAVGATTDPLEREAERIADQVTAANDLHAAPLRVQRSAGVHAQGMGTAPPSVEHALAAPGYALEPTLQKEMSARFGHDFSRVRVHTDGAAARSAREVNAHAYTVGNSIVFAAGGYAPHSPAGRHLIAHELAHVVQQEAGRSQGVAQRQGTGEANPLTSRQRQVACVVRRGGCSTGTYSRPGGVAEDHVPGYNAICRDEEKTGYVGPNIYPTQDECNNPPKEPLPTGAKMLLVAFGLGALTAATVASIVIAEAAIPVIIAAASEATLAAGAYYFANAIVINEIGLFAAGLIISCEGNVPGLLAAMANDPAQAAQMLAEVYILHTNVKVGNAPARPAKVSVKLEPASAQSNQKQVRLRTVGAPKFTDVGESHANTSPSAPKSPAQSKPTTAPPAQQPPQSAKPQPAPVTAPPPAKTPAPPIVKPGMSLGEAYEEAALKPSRSTATLLGEKAGGYDAHEGGTKVINSETKSKDKAGNPIVVRDVTLQQPDDAIQIKTLSMIDKDGNPTKTPIPELVANNVKQAIAKAYNQPQTRARSRTPLPGTNIYERTNIEAPKKITIIVQVPGKVTDEMRNAAQQVLKTDTALHELPPVEVIVQTRQEPNP